MASSAQGESGVTPTESKTTGTTGNSSHGSREAPATSASCEADRSGKARGRKPDMHAAGESDSFIVPRKQANEGGVPPAGGLSDQRQAGPEESVEGRELAKENAPPSLLDGTQSPAPRSRGLRGVRAAARRDRHACPDVSFARHHSR